MPRLFLVPAALACLFAQGSALAQQCTFRPAFSRPDERGTQRLQVYESAADPTIGGTRALLFVSSLKVNTDGTRISYNKDDPRARRLAINDVRNAMQSGRTVADFESVAKAGWPLPRTWTIVSASVIEKDRRTGKPCTDPRGYLVSKTAVGAVAGAFARDGDCDQSKWLDALAVNALVLPVGKTEFEARGATTRTPVVAMTNGPAGNTAFGLVGDKGPANELGEASVAMNRTLNGLPADDLPKNYADAVRRFQAPGSAVLLFPGAAHRLAYPLDGASVTQRTRALFDRWGGAARLRACVTPLLERR